MMYGWRIPPPKGPTKDRTTFEQALLKSARIKRALLAVPREDFIPTRYRDYAYMEVPLPLPGVSATISCPHSYPLFYEPLGLDQGRRFLEVGLGSGYGTAIAREVVADEGLAVALEIDSVTFEFARGNLKKAGYRDVVLVRRDGGRGYPELQPYDRIAITAACAEVPEPLLAQLTLGRRLIASVIAGDGQDLIVFERSATGIKRVIRSVRCAMSTCLVGMGSRGI